MKYFLDFDRTLFNTDEYYHVQLTHPFFKKYAADIQGLIDGTRDRQEVGNILEKAVENEESIFKLGEIHDFVPKDVDEFLKKHAENVTVITFGNPNYQRVKVHGAGILAHGGQLMLTGDTLKGEYLTNYLDTHDVFVFVDDSMNHLEDVHKHFPSAIVVEMRRDGEKGNGTFPVIHSLDQLEDVV